MATVTAESRATLRTSLGNLVLEFIPDKAPKTCENFVKLAHDGFYDGKTFHRVIKDFMVQGGCPDGNGKGGPGYTIRPEFNDTPHVKGTVSMARNNDPHSAGSQFFICTADARYLDSRYTAFARVVDGLDVLDKLNTVPTDIEPRFKERSVPRDPIFINGIELVGVTVEETPPPQKSAPAPAAETADDGADDDAEDAGDDGEGGDGGGEGGRRPRRTRRGRRGGSGRSEGDRGEGRGEGRSENKPENKSESKADSKPAKSDGDTTGDLFEQAGQADGGGDGDDKPARKKATAKKASSKKATTKKASAKKATRKKAARKASDDEE